MDKKVLLWLFVLIVLFTSTGCKPIEGGSPTHNPDDFNYIDYLNHSLLFPNGIPDFSYFDEELRISILSKAFRAEWSPSIQKLAETIPVEQTYDDFTFTWDTGDFDFYSPADKTIYLTVTNNHKDVSWYVWRTYFFEEKIDGEWVTLNHNRDADPLWWVGITELNRQQTVEPDTFQIPDSYMISMRVREGTCNGMQIGREYRLRFYVGNKEFTVPIPTMQRPSTTE